MKVHSSVLSAMLLSACASAGPAVPSDDEPTGDTARPADPGGPAPTPTPDPDPEAPAPSPDAPVHACPGDASARFDALVEAFRSALAAERVPGGAIAVVCGDGAPRVAGVGQARRDDGDAVTADTRFQWASSTKMLTAATALSLADAGVVDLHAPLSTYLPAVSYGAITLHHLLTHTAGFPTEFDRHDPDLAAVVGRNATMTMWAPPAAVWNYSNPGFAVAGRALEAAAGAPFAQLVQAHVTEPAGMTATMDVAVVEAGEHAYGHSDQPPYDASPIGPRDAYFHTRYYQPMGGLWGSARDLAAWLTVHLTSARFDAMHVARTRTTSPGSDAGYGMFVDSALSPTIVHHGGSAPGFLTEWRALPEVGFGVAVVVNADWFDPGAVADEAMDRFGVDVAWVGEDWPEGPEAYSHYVGTYEGEGDFRRVEVTVDGDRLLARFDGGRPTALRPWYGDVYDAELGGEIIDVTFWRDGPDADATYVVSLYGVAARAP